MAFYQLNIQNNTYEISQDKFKFENKDAIIIIQSNSQDSQQNKLIIQDSQSKQPLQEIHQLDLSGAEVQSDNKLHIFSLIKLKPGCTQKQERQQKQITISHENKQILTTLQNIIFHFVKEPQYIQKNQESIQNKQHLEFNEKLLVFVNPASGTGDGPNKWKKSKQLLLRAGYKLNEINTERRNHAADVVKDMEQSELLSYSAIVSMSGDGLPHEVVNSLAKRPDSDKVLSIGISTLPGGSGNALAKNVAVRSHEAVGVVGAIYNLIKGQKVKIDMTELTLDSQQDKVYSFVSLNYAFVADLDINSEFLRFLGSFRFDLYGFYRVLMQKKYPAKVYLRLGDSQIQPQILQNQTQENINNNWQLIDGEFKFLLFCNLPYIAEGTYQSPLLKMDDGYTELQALCNSSWASLFSVALSTSDGSNFDIKNQKPKRNDFQFGLGTEFMIECQQKNSLFSIDGEKFEAQNIKGKVLPKSLTIFCMDQDYQ